MKFIPKIEGTKIILVADGAAAAFIERSMGKKWEEGLKILCY